MVLIKKSVRLWKFIYENLALSLCAKLPSWINDIEVTLSTLFSGQFPGNLRLQVHLGREELQRILLIVLGNLFSYYWETYFLTLSCVKISLSSFSPSKSLVRVPSSSSFCLSTLPISVSHFWIAWVLFTWQIGHGEYFKKSITIKHNLFEKESLMRLQVYLVFIAWDLLQG